MVGVVVVVAVGGVVAVVVGVVVAVAVGGVVAVVVGVAVVLVVAVVVVVGVGVVVVVGVGGAVAMSIRRDPIYISYETWSSLRVIAKARSLYAPDGSILQVLTPDELANELIRGEIEKRWPQVVEHNKRVSVMEREIVKQLQQR